MTGNLPEIEETNTQIFQDLIKFHFERGTRARLAPQAETEPWTIDQILTAWGDDQPTPETVRNWLAGRTTPDKRKFGKLCQLFFGQKRDYADWKQRFRDAWIKARQSSADLSKASLIDPPIGHFIGRQQDLDKVRDALLPGPAQCVLVRGGPGVGKTTLTRAVGTDPVVRQRFGETHRWFVPLETAASNDALQSAITEALGLDPKQSFQETLNWLKSHPGLLLLDNLETPWDLPHERRAVEETLAGLAALQTLTLLASFRGADRIRGIDWALIHPVEVLEPPHDADLFCRIAGRTDRDDPYLHQLLEALGGVPLAIELVASNAHGRSSLKPIWERWNRVGADLIKDRDYDADRLTSLPHSIELSLASSRITDTAKRLFALLGALPGGLCDEDRDALLGDDGFNAADVLLGVGLATERGAFGERIDLLPPIREYARRRHPPAKQDDWRGHFMTLAGQLGSRIGKAEGTGAVARLSAEAANIEAAFQPSEDVDLDRLKDSFWGLSYFAYIASLPMSGLFRKLAQTFEAAADTHAQAKCNFGLGNIALKRSDHDSARKALEDALPLYQNVGDILGEANCIESLGDIALARSDHDGARKAYQEALPLYQNVGDFLGEANCIKGLGDIALRRSDHDGARKAYQEALTLYQNVGDILGEANCIKRLGDIALRRSEHDDARKAFEDALPLYQNVGDILGEANCVYSLGDIALRRSDHDDARKAYEEALPLYRNVGSLLGEANCHEGFGDLALDEGRRDDALSAWRTAVTLHERIGNTHQADRVRARIADLDDDESGNDA